MKLIKNIKGTGYFNDAGSADINAVKDSLQLLPARVIWIVGVFDECLDCSVLKPLIDKKKVKAVICLSKEKGMILDNFYRNAELIIEADSMEEAVKFASFYAKPEDAVLFSPAGSSFIGLTKDTTAMETHFTDAVNKLYIEH